MTKIYRGKEAQLINTIIGDDNAKLITPVRDDLTDIALGHLVIFKGNSCESRNQKYFSRPLTTTQSSSGVIGSFVFIGINQSIFNKYFNNVFTGKFTLSEVWIDQEYRKMISKDFVKLIQSIIHKYKDK